MKKYLFRKAFWNVFLYVQMHKLLGAPRYTYKWYETRMKLIKEGEI